MSFIIKIPNNIKMACLEIVGSFETGLSCPFEAVSGNFDGQGLSWGCLQWNLGQGTLQPIWKDLGEHAKPFLKDFYDEWFMMLSRKKDMQVKVGDVWYHDKRTRGLLQELGRNTKQLQIAHAEPYFEKAYKLMRQLGLDDGLSFLLSFDICVQLGSLKKRPDLSKCTSPLQKRILIAEAAADQANPKWHDDVLSRKMTCAIGHGKVHGRVYNLSRYGLLESSKIY